MKLEPGLHLGIAMPDYLKVEAVSASLLKTLLTRCPRAAWFESWQNPVKPPADDDTDAADAGTIAHSILLEGRRDLMEVLDPQDYLTESSGKAPIGLKGNGKIKAAAEVARAAGKIPVTPEKARVIESMVASAQAFIDSLREAEPRIWEAFQNLAGVSEATIVWDEGGALCKIRPDRMSNDGKVIVDAKFTGTSAEPDAWGRTQMIRMGYYISAAWYRRGVEASMNVSPDYYFLVVETEAPYLCSLVGVDPHGMELGGQKADLALREWKACTVRHQYPGYPARACYPEIPQWVDAEWTEKQLDSTPYWEQA